MEKKLDENVPSTSTDNKETEDTSSKTQDLSIVARRLELYVSQSDLL